MNAVLLALRVENGVIKLAFSDPDHPDRPRYLELKLPAVTMRQEITIPYQGKSLNLIAVNRVAWRHYNDEDPVPFAYSGFELNGIWYATVENIWTLIDGCEIADFPDWIGRELSE